MFTRTADLFFKIPIRRLAVYLWVIMLVRTGVWGMGSLPEQTWFALQPTVNPFNSLVEYIVWNYLGAFTAHGLFGFLSDNIWLFHLCLFCYFLFFAALASALFCYLAITRLNDHAARTALLLYFIFPISGTAYFWVGMDGLTQFLIILPFLFNRKFVLAAIAGFLLGTQHFEQGFVGYAALLASLIIARDKAKDAPVTLPWAACVLAGIVVGKIALIAWFNHLGLEVHNGRLEWFTGHAGLIISYVLLYPHITLASAFSIGWLAVFKFANFKELRWAFFLPLAGLLTMPFFAEDETRVMALVTFPLVAGWMLFYPRFLQSLNREFIGLLALLFVITPWLWVWRGEPRASAFSFDIAYVTGHVFGWPVLPDDLFKWLFRYVN